MIVLASIATSLASYGVLGEAVRIRWAVGVHYGPEYAPTGAVLAAFPAVIAVLYVGFRWLGRRLEGTDEFDEDRGIYELAALATLGMLVVVQVALVAANLYL